MFAILGVAGGAAAAKLLSRNKLPTDVRELKQQEEKLRKTVKALEKELQKACGEEGQREARLSAALKEAEQLKAKIEELRSRSEVIETQNNSLKEDVQQLQAERLSLSSSESVLKEQAQRLTLEKELLEKEVVELKTQHADEVKAYEEEIRAYQSQMDDLRAKVSDTVSRLLAHKLSEAEAAEVIRGLGCEIEYLEATPSSQQEEQEVQEAVASKQLEFSSQAPLPATALLLEDRGRLERLVVASTVRNNNSTTGALEAGKSSSLRVPMVTFPDVRGQMSRAELIRMKLPGLAAPAPPPASDASQANNKALPSASASSNTIKDVASKDQQLHSMPTIVASSAASTAKPHAAPAIKDGRGFVYSMQGKQGSQWLAKLPFSSGDQQAPAAVLAPSFTNMKDSFTDTDASGPSQELGLMRRP